MTKSGYAIRMSIFTGSLALLLAGGQIMAQDLYFNDFESQLPGQPPKGWTKAWGQQQSDRFSITSERAFAGERSMLIERFDNVNHWGMAMSLPKVADGLLALEFMLLYEGNEAVIGFELRDTKSRNQRLIGFSVGDSRLSMNSTKPGAKKKPRFRGGNVLAEKWYRVRVTFPLSQKHGDMVKCEWQEMPDGRVETCEVDMNFPENELGLLYINLPKVKTNFRVFIDNLKLFVVKK